MSEAEETCAPDNNSHSYDDVESLLKQKKRLIFCKNRDKIWSENDRPDTKHNIGENNISPSWCSTQKENPANVISSGRKTVVNVTNGAEEQAIDTNSIITNVSEDSNSFKCGCFGKMFQYLKRKLFKVGTSPPESKRARLNSQTDESSVPSSTNHESNHINGEAEAVNAILVRDIVDAASKQPTTNRQNDPSELLDEQIDEIQDTQQAKKRQRKNRRKNNKTGKMPEEIQNNPSLRKYWTNRYSLFSKYDEGIKLDAESWYSVTPEKISIEIARRCQCDVIIDAFCGAGGNTIQFAFVCERVIAIDIDAEKIKLAKHNAEIYGVADRIEFIVADFFQIAPFLTADVVFLSPPWGGPSYNVVRDFPLSQIMEPYGGQLLYNVAKQISEHIAYFLPRNILVTEVAALEPGEYVKIDRNYLDDRLVAITAYFGDLVEDYGDEWNN